MLCEGKELLLLFLPLVFPIARSCPGDIYETPPASQLLRTIELRDILNPSGGSDWIQNKRLLDVNCLS